MGAPQEPPERETVPRLILRRILQCHHLLSAFSGISPTVDAEPEFVQAKPQRDRIPGFKLSFTTVVWMTESQIAPESLNFVHLFQFEGGLYC